MKAHIKFFLSPLFFIISFNLGARKMSVSDTLPDIEVNNVLNYKSENLKLADFRGKLVILDFWGHNCLSCMEAFPKLDSLQHLFEDRIQIILINRESRESTEAFFRKRVKVKKPDIPMITGDTLLEKMFPHPGDPFHVWIDKNGKVLYRIDGYYATEKNIKSVLNGEDLKLPEMARTLYVETLFDEKFKNLLEYYSYISTCEPYLHIEPPPVQAGEQLLNYCCLTPIKLYQEVFNGLSNKKIDFRKPGRTIDQNLSAKYREPRDNEVFFSWLRDYTYSYQLYCKQGNEHESYQMMKNDLDKYFKLKATLEKRQVKCWALVKWGGTDKLRTKGGKPKDNFVEFGLRATIQDTTRYFMNKPFSVFFIKLKVYIEKRFAPLLDNTDYKGNIDIEINGDILDSLTIPGLRKELRRYNLDLIQKEILMDVLVIKETGKKRNE